MRVIIGAGLTGLSAAYHLDEEAIVVEKEAEPGGLCRSVTEDGFTYDLTGHLLHLRRPEIRELVGSLVPEEAFNRIDRRSFIYSHGLFTPYPFQVNTHGLPKDVVAECLVGFMEAVKKGELTSEQLAEISFKEWALAVFGSGVAKHFMFPYNEKLWLTDLSEMTCEWVSWAVPRPSIKDVVEGALGISRRAFGYNPSFLYPRAGGIRILPDALASKVPGVRYGAEVISIDTRRKVVTLNGVDGKTGDRKNEEIPYTELISTTPLPTLLKMMSESPSGMSDLVSNLRYTTVLNINLGVDRAPLTDMHWAYFPGKEFPFYRAGFPANFSGEAVPDGCSSMYIEVARKPGEAYDADAIVEDCRQGLIRCGILRAEDNIVSRKIFHISPAYVVYDRFRKKRLPEALARLREIGIWSVGRYGAWYYNSMEDSLAEGRDTALALMRAT